MSDYLFKGKLISGAHAVHLLRAIETVQYQVPNPTSEDIEILTKIADDFGKQFEEDLKAYAKSISNDE